MGDRSTGRGAEGALGEGAIDAAASLAAELMTVAEGTRTGRQRRQAARLSRLVADRAGLGFSLALTDEVARIRQPRRALRRLNDLVADHGLPGFLGPADRVMLRAALVAGGLAPGTVATLLKRRVRRETSSLVLRAGDRRLARHLARRAGDGIDLNVNVLGEAILGQDEADRRAEQVLHLCDLPGVDYVSVKASALCPRILTVAFDRSQRRVTDALRPLYRAAASHQPAVFVNLDMEEYRDLEVTVGAFRSLLDEPELAGLDAGIVLQAYLPDAHAVLEEVATWARRRRQAGGGRTKFRLVKGANLGMEHVEAELHGWTPAPYPTKAAVDASYKRLLERALDPCWGDGVRVGLASHNLFDVAWGLGKAADLDALDRLDVEMLEGMAPGQPEAVHRRGTPVRLYSPVVDDGERDAATAYLARRLDEQSAPDNYLRHHFDLRPGSPAFADQRSRFAAAVAASAGVDVRPRRVQDRSAEASAGSARSLENLARPFTNVADTDWAQRGNRAWMAAALADLTAGHPTAVGCRVDGRARPVRGSTAVPSTDPSHPEVPLYHVGQAGRGLVDEAVAVASGAAKRWGSISISERAAILARAGTILGERRGELVAAMVIDAGKVVTEGDVEVSEAVDLAYYYARQALDLDARSAHHRPLGTVVVAPPWNFPLAIPMGGVLAALAAGNSVILKPAPETVLTASMGAACLWDAGVPGDALQFLPCSDDEVGRRLITHRGVDAVILTGSRQTARAFLGWRPGLRLLAETSGKNAVVVTAAADLDLAVADLVGSSFGHAGQKCSAASLAIVERAVLDDGRFVKKLADATRTLAVGPAEDPATEMGPLIGPAAGPLLRALTRLDPGEDWVVRPRQLASQLWSPGIRSGVAAGSWFHQTECFGPVLGIMAAEDLDDAIAIQNATPFGLTGGLHSLDPAEIRRWLAGVEVGNAYVNRAITGAVVRRQPFGGWKGSAVGPTAKTGGPGYVAGLCSWSDAAGDRRASAGADYPGAWAELSAPSDPSGLRAERNELRHRPATGVVLRVERDADPVDVELCLLAAATTGAPVTVSMATDEPAGAVIAAWPAGAATHLRVLGTPDLALLVAAHAAGLVVDPRRPVADGRVELSRWAREQTLSITSHRYGRWTTPPMIR